MAILKANSSFILRVDALVSEGINFIVIVCVIILIFVCILRGSNPNKEH